MLVDGQCLGVNWCQLMWAYQKLTLCPNSSPISISLRVVEALKVVVAERRRWALNRQTVRSCLDRYLPVTHFSLSTDIRCKYIRSGTEVHIYSTYRAPSKCSFLQINVVAIPLSKFIVIGSIKNEHLWWTWIFLCIVIVALTTFTLLRFCILKCIYIHHRSLLQVSNTIYTVY